MKKDREEKRDEKVCATSTSLSTSLSTSSSTPLSPSSSNNINSPFQISNMIFQMHKQTNMNQIN